MAIPVLISVYTRLRHLQNCIESLANNDLAKETDLFIVSDAPKFPYHQEAVERVRDYIRTVKGFKSVHLFAWDENKGSSESIRTARMAIFEKFDAQIFMEDDNILSPLYLSFMNEAMHKYKDDAIVFGICGFNFDVPKPESYPYDVYFMNAISANGWGYWKDKYLQFFSNYELPDFKSKSFKVYKKQLEKPANNLRRMAKMGFIWGDTQVTHYLYEKKMVCLFPCISLVQNTGWDGTGEHCGKEEGLMNQPINETVRILHFPKNVEIDTKWAEEIKQFFKYPFLGKLKTTLFDFKVQQKNRFKRWL